MRKALMYLYHVGYLLEFGLVSRNIPHDAKTARIYKLLLRLLLTGTTTLTIDGVAVVTTEDGTEFPFDNEDIWLVIQILDRDTNLPIRKAELDNNYRKITLRTHTHSLTADRLRLAGEEFDRLLASAENTSSEVERRMVATVLRSLGCNIPH